MPEHTIAKVTRPTRAMSWLLDPEADISEEIKGVLLGQLLSSPLAIVMGSLNSLVISIAGVLVLNSLVFKLFVVLELSLLTARLIVILRVQRIRREGGRPDVGTPVVMSLLWCAAQGMLAFYAMQTDDLALMVLTATLILGIVGPICARNFAAPRLALLLVCLCDLPFKAGAALSGEPWLLLLLPMTAPFLVGVMQIVRAFQRSLTSSLNAEQRNRYLAHHDVLTGLLNRQGLEALLPAPSLEAPLRVAILGVDLDGFKAVNDDYGHSVGDHLLKITAERLLRVFRKEDLVARIGGDEFLIVVCGLHPDAIDDIGRRLVEIVSNDPYVIDGLAIDVRTSVGYACSPEDDIALDLLRIKADAALYVAKRSGKAACCRYSPQSSTGATRV